MKMTSADLCYQSVAEIVMFVAELFSCLLQVAVFAEAFPSLPTSSSSDPCDLDTVSTLAQILRGKASHEKG